MVTGDKTWLVVNRCECKKPDVSGDGTSKLASRWAEKKRISALGNYFQKIITPVNPYPANMENMVSS